VDAFEQLVAELFLTEGYWVETSVKVELTKDEKRAIGRYSTPRWEIDVIVFSARDNEVLAIECKSFLDSRGVQWAELQDGHASNRYKLFREPGTREVVLERLRRQLVESGRCNETVTVRLAMAAGKVNRGDDQRLAEHFEVNDWAFFGPAWLRARLHRLSTMSYSNQVAAVVARLLLRGQALEEQPITEPQVNGPNRGPRRTYRDDQVIKVHAEENPKRAGSQARQRFEKYFELKESTVGEAKRLGLRHDDFRNDVARGYISIE
jgi:hypothetical protein